MTEQQYKKGSDQMMHHGCHSVRPGKQRAERELGSAEPAAKSTDVAQMGIDHGT